MQNETVTRAEIVALPPLALDVEAAASATSICRTRIFAAIKEGRLNARKDGKRTVILVCELEAFLKSLPSAKREAA